MKIYNKIAENCANGKKMLAVLIDPDKYIGKKLVSFLEKIEKAQPDFIFVGGSLTFEPTEKTIETIKRHTDIPVILFPGNVNQFSGNADALLLLSLISGRNAEYLIGQAVTAAPAIYHSKIETIPVGYMLIDSGAKTSVEYISNTAPIPADKTDIALATALAGEMLGNKIIYLEAGSGTKNHVPLPMISALKKHLSVPIIVGGGIRTAETVQAVFAAGADIIVMGNALEENPELLLSLRA
ncbi:geranylgeranylglyceryl phosphate synthase [Bacteroidia bacterium]|nr:geranylgeranylglyceryl phosphate synthase [Bacteroidia bacterium]GHT57076.1 geranylgeranylglyceryl phosphate synthase [Bacteroidia bacterium]